MDYQKTLEDGRGKEILFNFSLDLLDIGKESYAFGGYLIRAKSNFDAWELDPLMNI